MNYNANISINMTANINQNVNADINISTQIADSGSLKEKREISSSITPKNKGAEEGRAAQNKKINRDIAIGFSFILSGLLKKVVLASYLSEHIVRDVFLTPDFYSSTTILVAVYAYAMQIYCDFSGYSDIAIGIGRLMGYKLPQNFNAPYLACSLQDFWRRWHITLSLWLRDYLYIPLGGSKKGNKSLNLLITMTLGGLWHGSHLRFLIWGFMHGMGLAFVYLWQQVLLLSKKKTILNTCDESNTNEWKVLQMDEQLDKLEIGTENQAENQPRNLPKILAEHQVKNRTKSQFKNFSENKATDNIKNKTVHHDELLILKPLCEPNPSLFTRMFKRLRLLLGWFLTFHFVSLLWIFFRAEDAQTAFEIIKRLVAFNLPGDGFPALALVAIFLTMFLQFFGPHIFRFFVWFLQKLWAPIQVLFIAIACAIILKLGPDGVLPFIYFQF